MIYILYLLVICDFFSYLFIDFVRCSPEMTAKALKVIHFYWRHQCFS